MGLFKLQTSSGTELRVRVGEEKSVFSVIQDTNQVSSDTIIIPFDTH